MTRSYKEAQRALELAVATAQEASSSFAPSTWKKDMQTDASIGLRASNQRMWPGVCSTGGHTFPPKWQRLSRAPLKTFFWQEAEKQKSLKKKLSNLIFRCCSFHEAKAKKQGKERKKETKTKRHKKAKRRKIKEKRKKTRERQRKREAKREVKQKAREKQRETQKNKQNGSFSGKTFVLLLEAKKSKPTKKTEKKKGLGPSEVAQKNQNK